MQFDDLSPDQKILLAFIDAGAKREALGFLSWKAKGEGYASRPDDSPMAAERYAKAMPQCFDNPEEKLTAFEAWKQRQNGKGVQNGMR